MIPRKILPLSVPDFPYRIAIFLLVIFGTLSRGAGNPETLRARLLSGDPQQESSALQEISEGAGDASFIPEIRLIHLRRGQSFVSTLSEVDLDLTAQALGALEALQPRFPRETTRALLEMTMHSGMSDYSAMESFWRSPLALDELVQTMKTANLESLAAAGALTVLRAAPIERKQNASPAFFSVLNGFLGRALRTGQKEFIYQAAGVIEAFMAEDIEQPFAPLKIEILGILNSDEWLPTNDKAFDADTNPHFAVALPALILIGKNPDLTRRFQKIYQALRKTELSVETNQFWINLINSSQGKATRDPDQVAVAREKLERTIEIQSHSPPSQFRAWIRAQSKLTLRWLAQLEPEEAQAYLKKVMNLTERANRNYRAEVARRLARSSNPALVDLALANPKCVKILEMLKRRKGGH